ncbi:hypothetical protein D3C75_579440 [compost metagenome]
MPNPRGPAANKAKQKYNEANYERIPLVVKAGRKAVYKAAAEAANTSLNSYIQSAIEEKMIRDKNDSPSERS